LCATANIILRCGTSSLRLYALSLVTLASLAAFVIDREKILNPYVFLRMFFFTVLCNFQHRKGDFDW
jgi:hypothetical protein